MSPDSGKHTHIHTECFVFIDKRQKNYKTYPTEFRRTCRPITYYNIIYFFPSTWARIERIPTTAMKAATVSDEKPITWGRRSIWEAQVRTWQDKHTEWNDKPSPHALNKMECCVFNKKEKKIVCYNCPMFPTSLADTRDTFEQTCVINATPNQEKCFFCLLPYLCGI